MGYVPVQGPPFSPKPKNPPTPKKDNPAKEAICHQCGEVGHWRRNCPIYLAELMKKKKLSQGLELEQPIPNLPVPPARQANPPDVVTMHQAWLNASNEIAGLMIMTMDPEIQKNLEHLGAYDMLKELKMLYAQQADQELLQTVREFHACKQEEGQSVSSYVLKMMSYIDNLERLGHAMTQNLTVSLILVSLRREYDGFVQNYSMHSIQKNQKKKLHKAAKGNQRKGKAKMGYAPVPEPSFAPEPKNPPTPKKDNPSKDAICHQCGEGLRGSRKLKPGALSLYVGDGHCAAVEAIGEFHLCLPSGLVLILHNCHYALSITRGIILVSRLYNDGFVNRFENDNTILVSKNNLVYFCAIPRDDIFEINLSSSNTNDSSMYAISNKRAKLNLDPTLLWHCLLGHINKKCMEKLQHDGLLDSTDIKSFEKYVSYPKETMGYSFYYPPENKVFVAQNVEFLKNSLIAQEASGSLEDLEIIQEEDTHPSLDTGLNHEEDDQEIDELQSDTIPFLDPESDKWLNAMNVEMQSMRDNEVWELVDLPPNDIRAIRILIAIAVFYDYEIWKMDVENAFLNRYLNEEQASRQWNKRFDDEVKKFGFSQNHDEPCVYVKASGSYFTFLILYVDDILIMGNNILMLQDVKFYLGRCFAMKDLGEVVYILGIKIYRDKSKRLIGLCQSAYIKKILKRFYMENSKRGMIQIQEKLKLSKSQGELHWTTVKNILKYLRNTKDMFLVYGDDTKRELRVSCYTDVGYMTDANDLKS
ncbi:putative retrotransposon protein [Tanacetum coccineum]